MGDLNGDLRSIADVVDEAAKLNVLLAGTKTQPGLVARVQDATAQASATLERLAQVPQLLAEIRTFPQRLLKPADEIQFRALLQESMAAALGGAIEDARKAAVQIGDEAGREQAKVDALEIFGEAVDLRAKLEAEKLMLSEVRKMLGERDGALQHSRDKFFDSIEALTDDYGAHAKSLSDAFAKATTKAVNAINAQNSGLSIKYAVCASIAFVVGHLTHDGLYSYIAKFMQ